MLFNLIPKSQNFCLQTYDGFSKKHSQISLAKLSAWKLSHRKALKTAVLPAVGMHPVV